MLLPCSALSLVHWERGGRAGPAPWAPPAQPSSVLSLESLEAELQKTGLREARHHRRGWILTSLSIKEFFSASTMSLSSVTEILQPLRNSRSSLYSNCNRTKAEEGGKGDRHRRKLAFEWPVRSPPLCTRTTCCPNGCGGFWAPHCVLGSSFPAPRPGPSHPSLLSLTQDSEPFVSGPSHGSPGPEVCLLSLPPTPHSTPVLLGSQMSQGYPRSSGHLNRYELSWLRCVMQSRPSSSHRFAAGMTWRPGWSPVCRGSTSSGLCWLRTASCSPAVNEMK